MAPRRAPTPLGGGPPVWMTGWLVSAAEEPAASGAGAEITGADGAGGEITGEPTVGDGADGGVIVGGPVPAGGVGTVGVVVGGTTRWQSPGRVTVSGGLISLSIP